MPLVKRLIGEGKRLFVSFSVGRLVSAEQFSFIHGVIDSRWYSLHSGRRLSKLGSIIHFLKTGALKGLAPSEAFSSVGSIYLSDVAVKILATAGIDSTRTRSPEITPVLTRSNITNLKRKRFAVCSASFGSIDRLKPIDPAYLADADFFAIVESGARLPAGWVGVNLDLPEMASPRLRARYLKTHLCSYFAAYDRVVWMDANVILKVPPHVAFSPYLGPDVDIATFAHPFRKSVLQEVVACIAEGKEKADRLVEQFIRYSEIMPQFSTVLYETNVMILNPSSDRVKSFCEEWWMEISSRSIRDQISFPYISCSRPDVRIVNLEGGDTRNSRFFIYLDHAKRI